MAGAPPRELDDIARAVIDGLNQTLEFIK